MFQELFDNLSDNSSVHITVMKSKDKLTVGLHSVMNIQDTVKDVIIPITFTDTPENVADKLPKLIQKAIPQITELADQIKANENAIAADKKAKEDKKKKKDADAKDKKDGKVTKTAPKKVVKPKPQTKSLFG